MDGSPQLLTNIQFAEAKKGYDRDQVDNFLRELSGKVGELQDMLRLSTQRAEAAEVALAEAEKARSLAEAAAAEATARAAAAPAPTGASDIEAATGVLAMAQKTAEATVSDAEAKARDIVADARDRAATIVVEVEREAERLKGDANARADQLVAERVTVIERDVERLSAQRDGLQLDVDLLRHYLDDHREKIRAGLDDINRILDQPGGLTLDKAPELGGTSTDQRIDSVTRPSSGAAPSGPGSAPTPAAADDAPTPAPAAADAGPASDPAPAPTPSSPTGTSSAGGASSSGAPSPTAVVVGDAPSASAASASSGGTATAVAAPATDDPLAPEAAPELTIVTVEDLTAPAPSADPEAEFPVVKAPEFFGEPERAPVSTEEPSIDLTGGSLFSQHTEEPTQAYDVLAGSDDEVAPEPEADAPDGSSLGQVEDEADEAMRAFFEQDLDAASKDDKPRGFLRRK